MGTNRAQTVLLADDDASIRLVISKFLTNRGLKIRATDNVRTLLNWLKNGEGDVLLSDVHMGVDNVFSHIPRIKNLRPDLQTIIISADSSVLTALKARRLDVFDYLPKPFDLEILAETVNRALKDSTKPNTKTHRIVPVLVGNSRIMQPVFKRIAENVTGNESLFLFGETGTGKTLCANVLHEQGERNHLPFLHAYSNLGDIPQIQEKNFYGDILIERIHELSDADQSQLLELLEFFERKKHGPRPRLIGTSKFSLKELNAKGKIREDLLFHFIGNEIYLPSLRERGSDFDKLVYYFLHETATRPQSLHPAAMKRLRLRTFAGNIRELKSILHRTAKSFKDKQITSDMIEAVLEQISFGRESKPKSQFSANDIRNQCRDLINSHPNGDDVSIYSKALAWVEKPLIEEALFKCGGNASKAAELLGIHRNTLRTKIKTLGIEKI